MKMGNEAGQALLAVMIILLPVLAGATVIASVALAIMLSFKWLLLLIIAGLLACASAGVWAYAAFGRY